jgi:hypothetical protein
MSIKPVWIVIGVTAAVVLFIMFSKRVSGFQNPTSQTDQADMKGQICSILNNTYNSSKINFDNLYKTDKDKAAIILIHLEAIKKQQTEQGCL